MPVHRTATSAYAMIQTGRGVVSGTNNVASYGNGSYTDRTWGPTFYFGRTETIPGLETWEFRLHLPEVGGPTAHSLGAVIDSSATVTPALRLRAGMRTTIDGVGTLSPALRLRAGMRTTIDAVGTVSPALKANRGLTALIAASGTVAPALRLRAGMHVTINSIADVVPNLNDIDGVPAADMVDWYNQHRKNVKRGR